MSIADRFVLQEQIGQGRMSSVYRAMDNAADDSLVAVKILNTAQPDEIKREVFKRETSALKRLSHPNIVGLRQSGWLDDLDVPYLVLDYLPYSLDSFLRGDSQLSAENFDQHRVMRELAQALAHAHSQDIIHRDIKPSNILLDKSGRPYLSDFGISKIIDHLTIGQTLADFWSRGYASPEQQAAKPATFKSDIYSLGAVFFHLLSGQVPQPEGPTPIAVDNQISGQPQIRAVLRRMLSENPDQREYTGASLVAGLEGITRQVETLPKHYLILIPSVISALRDEGYIPSDNFDDAAERIIDNFGGTARSEVYVQKDRRDPNTVRILGDSVRLICRPDREEPSALAAVAIHFPYQAELERDKEYAMPYRAVWEPVQSSNAAPANDVLDKLIEQLASFELENAAEQETHRSRRDFIDRWETVLNGQEQQIAQSGLQYERVHDFGDYLEFTLSEPPRDNLNWDEDAPLAVEIPSQSSNRPPRTHPIGNLVAIRGHLVEVAKDNRRSRRNEIRVPEKGRLMLNPIEVRSAISRQKSAIRAFRYGDMVNPNLANVIIEPDQATCLPEPSLDFYQNWLSEDKKEAVRKAMSSNEIFLIQGPPGTGKTAVIAEITLQILRRNPDARILLSSQSNIAVDHALTQIANAAGESPPAMIRLGRQEKISGQDWTIEGRTDTLRQDIQEKCSVVMGELLEAERAARADARLANVGLNDETDNPGTVAERIDEVKELVAELQKCERQHEMIQRGRGTSVMAAFVAAQLEETQARLKDQFNSLAELMRLPIAYTGENAAEVLTEIVSASAPRETDVPDSTGPAAELRRVQDLRDVVGEWMQIAGGTPDIMRLIVEQSNVVAATCLYSGGSRMPEANFDWAIVDEAGRATVPEVLVPTVKSERVILVGDERQLPPMVDDIPDGALAKSEDDYKLDTSLFQILVEQAEGAGHQHLAGLRRQYRMHPAIGNLISQVFYDGNLEQGRTGDSFRAYDWLSSPVAWLSTSALHNRTENQRGQSFANLAEAEEILRWLQEFEEQCHERRLQPAVGVISGYQAQVDQLTRLIDPENDERWCNLSIEVATVDSFQGRECDVVIYSTVRSNQERRIGFLRDYRRINVALSRARDLLIIVGDDFMMQNAAVGTDENPFAKVLEHIRLHPNECAIVPVVQRAS